MAIYLADFIEHSNNTLYAVDSNFVRGGIRSSHATWSSLLDTIDGTAAGTAGNIIGQLKPLSTMVWIGTASSGGFYVLTDITGADIAGTEANSGWKALSSLLGVTSSVAVVDAAESAASHYVVLSGTASGSTSLKTDAGIQYTPSTNLLDVTATSAQKWSTARTVNFNGSGTDVTGSFQIDGSANVSDVVLSIAANSVELGTNTFGDYVSTLTAGTGVLLTNSQATSPITETAQYTVALDYAGADSFIGAAGETTEAVVTGDFILIADTSDSGNVKKTALSNLPFTNYSAASITAGTGLSGGGTLTSGGTVTLDLDFSELTDMTADISGATEFILQNGDTESRKAANEIKLSNFVNDLGWTSFTGTVTSVTLTAGSGITITDSGTAITSSGTRTISLTNDSLTIGSTSIALGGTSQSLAGLTGLDFTANSASIAASIGANTLTLGGSTSTVSVPGDLSVAGNFTVTGSTTFVNSTNTAFKDQFIQLNRPETGNSTVGTLANQFAGISVFNVYAADETPVADTAAPMIRYNYSQGYWEVRQINDGAVSPLLTAATQSTLEGASVAETLQGTNATKYISPNDIRTWTAYNTSGIGISFPGSGVSNAAGTTEVQYAKTVKAKATVTGDDVAAGFFAIYHGLGNVYPIVNVYVADGNDYYQVIPKLIVDDEHKVKIYIQGMVEAQEYHIGITG